MMDMPSWAERLTALLAENRAALDRAIRSQTLEDWQAVTRVGKAVRDFFAASEPGVLPTKNSTPSIHAADESIHH
jgi:hypothetical protein